MANNNEELILEEVETEVIDNEELAEESALAEIDPEEIEVSDLADDDESKGLSPIIVAGAAVLGYLAFDRVIKPAWNKLKDKKSEAKPKKIKLTKEQKKLAQETYAKLLEAGYSPEDASDEFELLQRNADELPKIVEARKEEET